MEGGYDLGRVLVEAAIEQGVGIEDGGVIVVTCKLASKYLGLLVEIKGVEPSKSKVWKSALGLLRVPGLIELV